MQPYCVVNVCVSKFYTQSQACTYNAVLTGENIDLGGDVDGKIACYAQAQTYTCIEVCESGSAAVCAGLVGYVAIVGIGCTDASAIGELCKLLSVVALVCGIEGYCHAQSFVAEVDVKACTQSHKVVVAELVAMCGAYISCDTLVDKSECERCIIDKSAIATCSQVLVENFTRRGCSFGCRAVALVSQRQGGAAKYEQRSYDMSHVGLLLEFKS